MILCFQWNIKIFFLQSLLACSFVTVGIFMMQPFFVCLVFSSSTAVFRSDYAVLLVVCFFSSSAVFPVFMFSCCPTAAPLHCLWPWYNISILLHESNGPHQISFPYIFNLYCSWISNLLEAKMAFTKIHAHSSLQLLPLIIVRYINRNFEAGHGNLSLFSREKSGKSFGKKYEWNLGIRWSAAMGLVRLSPV